MDFHTKKKHNILTTSKITSNIEYIRSEGVCSDPSCFFCLMREPKSSIRRKEIERFFSEMPLVDDKENVLVLSGLWNIAMTQPNESEFPSLGIFECMRSLIQKGLTNRDWLQRHQNIYIPYYAAHIIGSYTMNKVEFAEMAVESGVVEQLMELLKGKLSWVEQRVAIRALGHLASYESTFKIILAYEQELIGLAMSLSSTCVDIVYNNFVCVKDENKRLRYHRDLLTRGIGGVGVENRKAEEWASQIQSWSINLLNTFASKGMSIRHICKQYFLKDLCGMWGGLVNDTSPNGVGLIRILCHNEYGRGEIAKTQDVIEKLCILSRSSDDWQYMGIDCLILLLNDLNTRYKVIRNAALCLVDLVEIKSLGVRKGIGETITKTLLMDFQQRRSKIKDKKVIEALEEIWGLKVEKRRKEKMLCEEKLEEKKVLVSLIKQQGNISFSIGDIEEAISKYTEGLDICPLKFRKERVVLYSNRAQCHLINGDFDNAIRDSTRALSLSNPVNSHSKSLWRRSQAYDMKELAKESLLDCLMFINGCITCDKTRKGKVPYYAARMISKQMDATWIFANAQSKETNETSNKNCFHHEEEITRIPGLSTIEEEPLMGKSGSSRIKVARVRGLTIKN